MTHMRSRAQGWRIGELAQRAGVNPKTIRYYEEAGLLPPPNRSESGYRTYSDADAAQLGFIRAAKDFGFTLGEIRELLAVRDRNEAPCTYVLGLVETKLADLNDRIRRLQLLSEELQSLLHDVAAMPAALRAQKGQYCHVIEHRHGREQEGPSVDSPGHDGAMLPHALGHRSKDKNAM